MRVIKANNLHKNVSSPFYIWSPAGVSEDMDSYVDILVMVAIHSDMNILQEACYSLFPFSSPLFPFHWQVCYEKIRSHIDSFTTVYNRKSVGDFRKLRNNEKSANFPILSRLKQGLYRQGASRVCGNQLANFPDWSAVEELLQRYEILSSVYCAISSSGGYESTTE